MSSRTSSSSAVRRVRLRTLVAATGLALVVPPLTAAPASADDGDDIPCGLIGLPLPIGDCVPPVTQITRTPKVDAEGRTPNRVATFTFQEDGGEGSATFECMLAGPGRTPTWADCTGAPVGGLPAGSVTYGDLQLGEHVFSVRATDQVGNLESPAKSFTWTVAEVPPPPDVVPPTTRFTVVPKKWHLTRFVSFRYRADEPAFAATCLFDGRPLSCTPTAADVIRMTSGDHTFSVRLTDDEGNVEPTPAVTRFNLPFDSANLPRYSRGWKQRSDRGHFLNTYAITSKKGASVTRGAPRVRSIALVVTRCPDCGTVRVSLGKQVLGTYELTAKKLRKRQVVRVASFRKVRQGNVTIQVVSRNKPVYLEGLGISTLR